MTTPASARCCMRLRIGKSCCCTGVNAIHSEVMDVDGDGDLDYVGYALLPGLIFWLERPRNPLKDP